MQALKIAFVSAPNFKVGHDKLTITAKVKLLIFCARFSRAILSPAGAAVHSNI
jgi:hypothetical protein